MREKGISQESGWGDGGLMSASSWYWNYRGAPGNKRREELSSQMKNS